MIVTFICRYGCQDINTVLQLSEIDRCFAFHALSKHLEAEFKSDTPTQTTPTE